MLKSLVLKSGRRVCIEQDYEATSPRGWDNVARLFCRSNRYFDLDENLAIFELRHAEKEAVSRGDYVFPLFAYVHSGVSLSLSSFSCPWDSGRCGFAVVRKGDAKNKSEAERIVKHELNRLNEFFAGEVFVVYVESPTGFIGVVDDSISEVYLNDESELISILRDLDLTENELAEAIARVSELMP